MEITSVNVEQMKTNVIEVSELLKTMAHPERLMVLCGVVDQISLKNNNTIYD